VLITDQSQTIHMKRSAAEFVTNHELNDGHARLKVDDGSSVHEASRGPHTGPSTGSKHLIWNVISTEKPAQTFDVAQHGGSLEEDRSATGKRRGEKTVCFRYSPVGEEIIHKATSIANEHGGTVTSQVTFLKKDKELEPMLAFKCKFNHIFRCTMALAQAEWCPMCGKNGKVCSAIAAANSGQFLGVSESKEAQFRCARGHQFGYRVTHVYELVYHRNRKSMKWCRACRLFEAKREKQLEEQQLAQERASLILEQERLLREAQEQMEKMPPPPADLPEPPQTPAPLTLVESILLAGQDLLIQQM
jgi:hypothetical protein